MPSRFYFDSTFHVLMCKLDGPVTDESFKQYYREIADRATSIDHRAGILDLSAVTSFEVLTETLQALAYSDPAVPDPTRPRIVVAPGDHIFGMSRMFQMLGENTRPRLLVVRTMEEAYSAIGIETADFERLESMDSNASMPPGESKTKLIATLP